MNKPPFLRWVQFLLLVLPFVVALIVWPRFPAHVAIHWDIHGRPDGWMAKKPGIFLLPALNFVCFTLLAWLPSVDPKLRANPATASATLHVLGLWRLAFSAFLSFASLLVIAVAAGSQINVTRVLLAAALLLLLALAANMAELGPNTFAGIRFPWTMRDPDVWERTHRAAARVIAIGALFLLALQFLLTNAQFTLAFLICIILLCLWSAVYSYRLSKPKNPPTLSPT